MNSLRVLLADDHVLVRAGIRALLQNINGIQVVAEAGDGSEALRLIPEHRPDVILMDIHMPGMSGIDATLQVRKKFPHVHVIILSMHANEEYVLQSLRAGARGYLLKGSRTIELELALTAVARGETYLSPEASKYAVGEIVEHPIGERPPTGGLTARQSQVLQLIARGHSRKQIAQKMDLSVKTIDTYRAQLMSLLNIHDTAGLVRYALEKGLLQ